MVTRFFRLVVAPGLAIAGLALPQSSARAGMVTFTAAVGGSALDGQSYANFDNRALNSTTQTTGTGVTVAFTGTGGFVQGSNGDHAAPVLSGGNDTHFATTANPTYTGADATTYVTTGTGSATLTFASGSSTYFGILWGSIDAYNSLTFDFTDGTTQTITGTAILGALNNASAGATTAYVNFAGSAFSSVVASSTSNAFEFDNVAFSPVPEPSSLALCGIAGVIGTVVARKRVKPAVA